MIPARPPDPSITVQIPSYHLDRNAQNPLQPNPLSQINLPQAPPSFSFQDLTTAGEQSFPSPVDTVTGARISFGQLVRLDPLPTPTNPQALGQTTQGPHPRPPSPTSVIQPTSLQPNAVNRPINSTFPSDIQAVHPSHNTPQPFIQVLQTTWLTPNPFPTSSSPTPTTAIIQALHQPLGAPINPSTTSPHPSSTLPHPPLNAADPIASTLFTHHSLQQLASWFLQIAGLDHHQPSMENA